MTTLKNHASGGIPPNRNNRTSPLDLRMRHIHRPRQFKRLEALRPMTSWLCSQDFTRLEKMRHESPPLDLLLGRLLCTKLADARLLDSAGAPHPYAAFGDNISYSLNDQPPQTALLGIPETQYGDLSNGQDNHHANTNTGSGNQAYLDLRSFIGLTVIGLKPGQRTRLLSADGTVGTLTLHSINRAQFPTIRAVCDLHRPDGSNLIQKDLS
ncbi:hypothetical protein [Thalassospira alkalitolerans]|uniref:hypothetical protein n=1 Tax=Thalassospira alkalitolerans TaxID=1293890 RepID=UPI003AA82071